MSKRPAALLDQQWLHIDINSYFATLLQQEVPALRGRPLAIVKDVGRTCVIAASKEAKKFGIGVGTNVVAAKKLVPNLKILPCEFEHYLSATRILKQIFTSFSPDIEIFSLDETFLYFPPLWRHYVSAQDLARLIAQQIKKELGEWVTCNIGIARTRFLAKMAGETAPKDSITWVKSTDEWPLLATTQFKDVCGIGPRLETKLALLNINRLLQINFVSLEKLETIVGSFWAAELKNMAQGNDPLLLTRINDYQSRPMKSIGRSITGFQLWQNPGQLKAVVENLAAEAMFKARTLHLLPRQLSIGFFSNQQRWFTHRTFGYPLFHTRQVSDWLWQLVENSWRPFPVIKVAIRLSLLEPEYLVNPPLTPSWQRAEQLEMAVNALANRYGLYTVSRGWQLQTPTIKPEVTGFFGDKAFYL